MKSSKKQLCKILKYKKKSGVLFCWSGWNLSRKQVLIFTEHTLSIYWPFWESILGEMLLNPLRLGCPKSVLAIYAMLITLDFLIFLVNWIVRPLRRASDCFRVLFCHSNFNSSILKTVCHSKQFSMSTNQQIAFKSQELKRGAETVTRIEQGSSETNESQLELLKKCRFGGIISF